MQIFSQSDLKFQSVLCYPKHINKTMAGKIIVITVVLLIPIFLNHLNKLFEKIFVNLNKYV